MTDEERHAARLLSKQRYYYQNLDKVRAAALAAYHRRRQKIVDSGVITPKASPGRPRKVDAALIASWLAPAT